jgi:hypothetical protein
MLNRTPFPPPQGEVARRAGGGVCCDCNACANLGTLDLEFIVHHGEFLIQSIGTNQELVGDEVIVAHRRQHRDPGLCGPHRLRGRRPRPHPLTDEWTPHREAYDFGEVECWVADMTPVWEAASTVR